MTATVIDFRTRRPVPLQVTSWRPCVGERITVLIPEMEGNTPSRWPAVVRSGPVGDRWMVEREGFAERTFPVSLSEMRPEFDRIIGGDDGRGWI